MYFNECSTYVKKDFAALHIHHVLIGCAVKGQVRNKQSNNLENRQATADFYWPITIKKSY
jgi:hypothetical protein